MSQFANDVARVGIFHPTPIGDPGEGLPNNGRLLRDAAARRSSLGRGAQTATSAFGMGGKSPLQTGLDPFTQKARNLIAKNAGLNDDEAEELNQLGPNVPVAQVEAMAKGIKNRPQGYQSGGTTGPRGTISIAPGQGPGAISPEAFAAGQARVKAGLTPGENMVSDVSDGAEGAVPGYTVSTPGTETPQNPLSHLVDSFKGQVSDDAMKQAQALMQVNPQAVPGFLQHEQMIQNTTKAHTEVMQGRVAQQLRSHLEKGIALHQKLIAEQQKNAEMAGDPNSPEGQAATQQIGTLQQELQGMQKEYDGLNEQPGQQTRQPAAAGQGQPIQVNSPEEAANLPPGTPFITHDGRHLVHN